MAEAEGELERVAAADARFSNVLWHLGRLYLRQGRVAEGKKLVHVFESMHANALAFETALEQLEARPQDPALHHRLAVFHLQSGELPQANTISPRQDQGPGGALPVGRIGLRDAGNES